MKKGRNSEAGRRWDYFGEPFPEKDSYTSVLTAIMTKARILKEDGNEDLSFRKPLRLRKGAQAGMRWAGMRWTSGRDGARRLRMGG